MIRLTNTNGEAVLFNPGDVSFVKEVGDFTEITLFGGSPCPHMIMTDASIDRVQRLIQEAYILRGRTNG